MKPRQARTRLKQTPSRDLAAAGDLACLPFPRLLPIWPGDEPGVKVERPERSEDERP